MPGDIWNEMLRFEGVRAVPVSVWGAFGSVLEVARLSYGP